MVDTPLRTSTSRRGSSKSSRGCITCKTRRIKCDESRPACRRCTSTGRKCDGYAKPPLRQVSIYNNRTQAQVQAFNYFTDQIAPGMTHVVDTEFWERLLLQASQTDSTVWLATTAMSELVRQSQLSCANRQLALVWYTGSINELQTRMKTDMKWSAVCSITAILYICIECLLNNITGVMAIYQRVMDQMSKMNDDAVSSAIIPLLKHITAAHGLLMPWHSNSSSRIPAQDAQEIFNKLMGESHQFVCYAEDQRTYRSKDWQPPEYVFSQRDAVLAKLKQWHDRSAFDESLSSLARSCMHLARLNYVIWVSAILDNEMAFDRHNNDFEEMLQQAEIAMSTISESLFSFETRVIPSLGFVAMRCRHPLIRRRALQMLHRGPRIENTRHAASTIRLAKRIIAIEESGSPTGEYIEDPACPDLPSDTNRLIYVKVDESFNSLGCSDTYLTFARWRHYGQIWREEFETVKV